MKLLERMMRAKHELIYEILQDYRRVLWACAAGGDKQADIPITGEGYGKRLDELWKYAEYPVTIQHHKHGVLKIQSFEDKKEWYLRVVWDLD